MNLAFPTVLALLPQALTHALIERETLSGPELRDVLAPTVVEPFESPYLEVSELPIDTVGGIRI